MRRILIAAAIAFGVPWGTGQARGAEDMHGCFALGILGGVAWPVGDNPVRDQGGLNPGTGFMGRYFLDPKWALAASYEFVDVTRGRPFRSHLFAVSAIRSWRAESLWRPFVECGVGAAQTLSLRSAAGVEYLWRPLWSVRFQGTFYWLPEAGGTVSRETAYVVSPGVLVSYFFDWGRRPRAPVYVPGAPAHADSDGDGVVDPRDACPGTPSGTPVDSHGCPLDSDGDGVIDVEDHCPDTPAGTRVDRVGCPLDSDGDGVLDLQDLCPDTKPGAKVNSVGCPVLEATEKISIRLNVLFDTDKHDIKPEFRSEIQRVADFMKQYPETSAVIEGHTDIRAPLDYNMALSDRRANAVRSYLIAEFGIEASRLTAKGYGPTRPIATNSTVEGMTLNRRVVAEITVDTFRKP